MPEDDTSEEQTRRDVLRLAAGTAAAGAVGLFGTNSVTAARRTEPSDKQFSRATSDDRVQSLLSALDDPKIDKSGSEVLVQTIDESKTSDRIRVRVTTLDTEAGTIQYGKVFKHSDRVGPADRESHEPTTVAAQLLLHEANRRGLPDKYREYVGGDPAILVGKPDGVVLSREATRSERKRIEAAIPADVGEMLAFTESDMDGFVAKVTTTDGRNETYRLQQGHGGTFTLDEGPSIADHQCDEENWCWKCIQSTAVCSGCYMACGGVSPACVICLVAACGATGFACTECIECNT
jgi:hypothetical protein